MGGIPTKRDGCMVLFNVEMGNWEVNAALYPFVMVEINAVSGNHA